MNSDVHGPTRRSYDEVAEEYASRLADELSYKPLDRALLGAMVEQAATGGPIADVGCGPGHVAAWLSARGANAVGIDISPRMIALARERFPEIQFREGDLLSLPAPDGEFAAVVALYSIIHLPPLELPVAFEEMKRTLQPGGLLLVSFHIGTETRHVAEWWGHEVDVDFHFYEPDSVVELVERVGFVVEAELERRSYPEEVETRRAYLLASRD